MTSDRRTFVAGLGALIPASLASSCAGAAEAGWPVPETPDNQLPKLPIGMNLAGFADYSPGYPFRNLMWGAQRWLTRNSFGGGPWHTDLASSFEYDADGYPLEVPIRTPERPGIPQQIYTILPNRLTPGRYIILYEGEGSFDGFQATQIISEQQGRVVIHMAHGETPGKADGIVIRTSKRGNHIRNIRIVAAKDETVDLEKQPFRDDFLKFCRPFHALRFMDWLATNGSYEDEWGSRRRPTFYTMIGTGGDVDGYWGPKASKYQKMYSGGIAHEWVIHLANTLGVDPWICLPHKATDEYIRQCAALYREKLDHNRRVYVEYSNEVWNWGFVQSHWMLKSEYAAQALEAKGLNAWEMRNGALQGAGFPERIGALFSRAFRLWTEEWAGRDRPRCVMVCAVMAGWTEIALRTIDWCHGDGLIDAVAPAAYFAPDAAIYRQWEARGADLTPDEVISAMRQVVEKQGGTNGTYQIARRAAQYGLAYLNYEGGQHILPEGQQKKPYMPALKAAQFHPEMYKLYVEILRQQRRLGSKLFCAYNSVGIQGSQWGSWGAVEDYGPGLSQSQKYRALVDCNS